MEGAQADSVFQFVSPAFVFHWDDVGCINKVELDAAHGATEAIRGENIFAEAREHLFFLAPTEQECLCAFLNAERVNARDLNSEFVRISRIAAVRQIPNVAENGNPLVGAEKRELERMLRRQNDCIPSRSFDR